MSDLCVLLNFPPPLRALPVWHFLWRRWPPNLRQVVTFSACWLYNLTDRNICYLPNLPGPEQAKSLPGMYSLQRFPHCSSPLSSFSSLFLSYHSSLYLLPYYYLITALLFTLSFNLFLSSWEEDVDGHVLLPTCVTASHYLLFCNCWYLLCCWPVCLCHCGIVSGAKTLTRLFPTVDLHLQGGESQRKTQRPGTGTHSRSSVIFALISCLIHSLLVQVFGAFCQKEHLFLPGSHLLPTIAHCLLQFLPLIQRKGKPFSGLEW